MARLLELAGMAFVEAIMAEIEKHEPGEHEQTRGGSAADPPRPDPERGP